MGAVFPPKSFTVYLLLLFTPCNSVTSPELLRNVLCPSSVFASPPQCWALAIPALPSSQGTILFPIPGLCTCRSSIWRLSPLLICLPPHQPSFPGITPTSPSDVSSRATFLGNLPPPCSFVCSFLRTVFYSFMLLSQFGFTPALG